MSRWAARIALAPAEGQPHGAARALPEGALDHQRALGRLEQAAGEEQAESRSLRFGGEERLGYLAHVLGRDAGAGVGDRDLEQALALGGRDFEAPALGHRLE